MKSHHYIFNLNRMKEDIIEEIRNKFDKNDNSVEIFLKEIDKTALINKGSLIFIASHLDEGNELYHHIFDCVVEKSDIEYNQTYEVPLQDLRIQVLISILEELEDELAEGNL